jgi:hypothetical protein
VGKAALETYLAGVDDAAAPVVIALDEAIRKAHPALDVAIKYRMLMYGLNGDWRRWVCAIGSSNKSVALRFLYGVLLDDPRRVLRAGSSVLKTWDFAFSDLVDQTAVSAYVADAVARYDYYKANAAEVLDSSRTSAPKTRGKRHVASG